MNNLANCFHNQKKYGEAASVFKKIKDSLQAKDDIYYKISSNLAKTLWYENAKYNPIPAYLEAKEYYAKEKDDWGLDASYAYLSEYYLHTNKDSAIFYSNKMYDIANKLKSPVDRLEALQNMIVLEKEISRRSILQNIINFRTVYRKAIIPTKISLRPYDLKVIKTA